MQRRQCTNDSLIRENCEFGYEGRVLWNRFKWGSGLGCELMKVESKRPAESEERGVMK